MTEDSEGAGAARPDPEQLLGHARDWAETWAGAGAVFSARTAGRDSGPAELLVAPVRESRGKPVISTQKALTELTRETREITEYAALHASWAAWCTARIDSGIRQVSCTTPAAAPNPPPARPSPNFWDSLRLVDLSVEAAERLSGLLTLKRELARQREQGRRYTAPEGSLCASDLKRPSKVVDPWPFIWSIRAPAQAVIDAAWDIGVGLDHDDPGYERGQKTFPELEDRIRLAIVVATCGYHCARTEARVKSAVFDRPQRDPDTLWPQGALQELHHHQDALEVHLAGKTGSRAWRRPPARKPR